MIFVAARCSYDIFGVVPALPHVAFNRPYTSASETEEIYACHAAGIVAAANPNWLDELGDVRVEEMSMQWKAGHGTCLDSGPYSGD